MRQYQYEHGYHMSFPPYIRTRFLEWVFSWQITYWIFGGDNSKCDQSQGQEKIMSSVRI
jgi:hypothetical protein